MFLVNLFQNEFSKQFRVVFNRCGTSENRYIFDRFQIYSMSNNKLRLLGILFYKTFDLGLLHLIYMPSHETRDM